MASLEEGDEQKDEARIDEFHQFFPTLREDKVVTCAQSVINFHIQSVVLIKVFVWQTTSAPCGRRAS
jgi:hypothetical protein